MLYGSRTVLSAPVSTAKRMVAVRDEANAKSEDTMLNSHVKKLPHLLKIARMPQRIVASVVQNAISYAMNIHLLTSLYALSPSAALLPRRLVSSAVALFSSLASSDWTALGSSVLPVGVESDVVLVAFRCHTSIGSNQKEPLRDEQ